MDYKIRELAKTEYPLLKTFLYEAIFQRDGQPLLPRSIIERTELQAYIQDFGQKEQDYCLCAEVDSEIVGVVWIRNIAGYGSIDSETPEFSISVLKEYRGAGIGTSLMREMLKRLKEKGYRQASLAVQKDNYALRMYQQVGFEIIAENEQEYIMICHLEK